MKVLQSRIALLISIALLAGWVVPFAIAQTSTNPTLWVTWRAATYIPSKFQGRALPSPGSSVVVALDGIQDGTLMDLSQETIYWYINDHYLTGGTGLTRTSITIPDQIGQDSISIRASLPNTLGGIAKTIIIPVVSPQAVIEVVPPDPAVTNPGTAFDVLGEPYFFTVNDIAQLSFDWSVNNQVPSTVNDPSHLHITIPAGTPLGTQLAVHLELSNAAHAFESAVRDLLLTVQ